MREESERSVVVVEEEEGKKTKNKEGQFCSCRVVSLLLLRKRPLLRLVERGSSTVCL